MYHAYFIDYFPDQQMHNIHVQYINNILYIVSTPTYCNASASSSGSLDLVFAKVTKLLKLLKLQLPVAVAARSKA